MPKKERKPKEKKAKINNKKPLESTQFNIPIKDVYGGVLITENNQFIKLMEVKPQPFFLKKNSERNRITAYFERFLKQCPDEVHIKSMSVPADLSYQIDKVKGCVDEETNQDCKIMGQEYVNRLSNAQLHGVTRRFFVSFPYRDRQTIFSQTPIDQIVHKMDFQAQKMEKALEDCGNEVIHPEDPNNKALKTMYMVYNRDCFLSEPFEERVKIINSRYLRERKDEYFYVPPKDYIAPKKIQYNSYKYLQINDTYYAFLYIPSRGYQTMVSSGWLTGFITSRGVDVDIFLKRVPKKEVINGIKRAIGYSRAEITDSSDMQDSFEKSMNTLGSAQYLKKGLSLGNDFYYMSVILTLSGKDLKKLAEDIEVIKTATDIKFRQNLFRCEETFNAVLPTGQYDDSLYTFKKSRRNILSEGAASLYPFTTLQLTDKEGLYIADDFTGSPILLDQFNRRRIPAPHIFLAGITGAGKTTTLMLTALRARVRNIPVFMLAPEKQSEYLRLTKAIGGQFIDIGAGSKDRINIMEIFPTNADTKRRMTLLDGEDDNAKSDLLRKTTALTDFFSMHIKNITSTEQFDLQDAIIETYERFGITSNNESLWLDENHTRYKKMPIISDLIETLEQKKDTARISKIIKLLTVGNGEHFNGQTNVDINNKFVVIGLQHNSEEMLPLATFLAMEFCLSKILEDRRQRKFLMIDESWKLIMEPSGYGCKQIVSNSRLLRAAECSMIVATQNLSSIMAFDGGRNAKEIINNCHTRILMQLSENEAYSVADLIDLTAEEVNAVRGFKPGQALLLAGETRLKMMMTPSPKERMLTFTDKQTLDAYIEEKAKEEDIKHNEELVELDDLFNWEEEEDGVL